MITPQIHLTVFRNLLGHPKITDLLKEFQRKLLTEYIGIYLMKVALTTIKKYFFSFAGSRSWRSRGSRESVQHHKRHAWGAHQKFRGKSFKFSQRWEIRRDALQRVEAFEPGFLKIFWNLPASSKFGNMLVLGRWSNLIRARYVTPICLQGQANKKQEYVEKIETINRIQTAQQDIINWLSAQSVLFEERYKMSWVNRQYWSKSARVIMMLWYLSFGQLCLI